ncbi:MAG: YdeI/OmpD-associated family protein [Pseudomonadota bacterium]
MSLYFDHDFDGRIESHDVGSSRYRYTVVFVPAALADELDLANRPRSRIRGEINDEPIDAGLTPVRGRWYILLSKAFLKRHALGLGDTVNVRFSLTDGAFVDVPDALALALSNDRHARAQWDEQTPGMQRGLAYRVATAKRDATIAKRVSEVLDVLAGKQSLQRPPIRRQRRSKQARQSDDD